MPTAEQLSLTTDAALIKLGHDTNRISKRVNPIYEFFGEDYRKRKNRSYLQAAEAAGGRLAPR